MRFRRLSSLITFSEAALTSRNRSDLLIRFIVTSHITGFGRAHDRHALKDQSDSGKVSKAV
jgi:hypothetical protein